MDLTGGDIVPRSLQLRAKRIAFFQSGIECDAGLAQLAIANDDGSLEVLPLQICFNRIAKIFEQTTDMHQSAIRFGSGQRAKRRGHFLAYHQHTETTGVSELEPRITLP